MVDIYYTDELFEPSEKISFNKNKRYDNNWVMLKLLDQADFFLFTGSGKGKLFQVIVTKKCVDWKFRIMDFIEYESAQNKNLIIAVSKSDLDVSKREYQGYSYKDRFLRPYENKVLVHSMTWDCWQSINSSSYVKSWNILKKILSKKKAQ